MKLNDALDYAILSPLATRDDIKNGCIFATKHRLKSVCVSSCNVQLASGFHDNVCSVIGFPHGNMTSASKSFEASEAMINGAKEIDVVINYGKYLDGDLRIIENNLKFICAPARLNGVFIKVILETCHYTVKQLTDACKRCANLGVDFVKTSTGFGSKATLCDVGIMLDALKGTGVQVKASGGINKDNVQSFLDIGCTRIGSSKYLELL